MKLIKEFQQARIWVSVTLSVFFICSNCVAQDQSMFEIEMESLMQVQVTSAGRKEQDLMNVPSAIYVISAEDIREYGATSLPEALRMVPGMQVYQTSSSKWAVASRGFNGIYSNKLLVQIDGRSIYTPSFSGVYWDVNNVMLEDVDRIEVIRGPGATLWGANAVNGVINVITKPASDTMGGLVTTGTGNHEKQLQGFRYGMTLGQNTYGRFYVQHKERNSFKHLSDSSDAGDDWDITYGGFRLDGDVGVENSWTFQGDIYAGEENQLIFPYFTADQTTSLDDEVNVRGYNLLGRWERRLSNTSKYKLQTYFDVSDREEGFLDQTHRTFDLDFQHRWQALPRHDIVWGLGFRNIRDDFDNTYMMGFNPDSDSRQLYSGFLQDEITLIENRLWLTLGSKFERNDFTGSEIQPSARLLWRPAAQHSLWASVSKAVRTPSRIEESGYVVSNRLQNPFVPGGSTTLFVNGKRSKPAEELVAYELGYRFSDNGRLSMDITAFYHDYHDLTVYDFEYSTIDLSEMGMGVISFPDKVTFSGGMGGNSRGFEGSFKWSPLPWFSTEFNYTYIRLSMDFVSQENLSEVLAEESSPRHQAWLKSRFQLHESLNLNLYARYVDELPTASPATQIADKRVPDYVAVDATIIWDIREDLQFSLVGKNLLDPEHLEYINDNFARPIEIERSVYGKITWSF